MKARAMGARAAGWLVLVVGAVAAAPPAARAQAAPAGAQAAPAGAAAAGAQAPPESAAAAQASRDADAAFARGKELYRLGKLDAAYEAYRTAWSLKQSYDIAANLANTEVQRGMKVEAARAAATAPRAQPADGVKAAEGEAGRRRGCSARSDRTPLTAWGPAAEAAGPGAAVGREAEAGRRAGRASGS
ncbi:hypothetical protein [Sorangium sp. So ce887]|uniref:hypothetical protein n=1 Tax=Sorangium sp. So ce887 TaxID=3133324 RepID=UPI003F5F9A82